MITKEIKCDVYLEGIQVEFNTINLTEQMGSPPVATITFPPDKMALSILPKTVCHVFYWDEDSYKLMFQGELIGYGNHYGESYREVKLQFAGFTHNWVTTPMLPLDISLQNIADHAAYLVNYPSGDTASFKSFEFQADPTKAPVGPLQALAQKLTDYSAGQKGGSLSEAIMSMIRDGFTNQSVYLKAITAAFNIFSGNQIKVFNSSIMSALLKHIAITQYLAQNIMSFNGPTPIRDVLTSVLGFFGYTYHEVATPSITDKGIRRIFVGPETNYFTAPNCNIIFDDEINQLLFDRNLEIEPTRVVNEIAPFQGVGETPAGEIGFVNTLMSTVLPQGVMIPEALSKLPKKDGKITSLAMLGLTEEEQCRGITLSRERDTTGIESAFVVHALQNQFKDKELKTADEYISAAYDSGDSTKALKAAYATLRATDNDETRKAIHYYHVGLGMTAFQNARLSRRTASLTTPYSPYRITGFPAVIVTKYMQILTGTITGSSSVISANGQAAQNLTLSFIRTIPLKFSDTDLKKLTERGVIPKESAAIFSEQGQLSFFDDEIAPPYIYKDFYTLLKKNEFYPEIVGKTKSEPIFTDVTTKGITKAASSLFLKYFLDNAEKKDTFRHDIIWRPLASIDDVETYWVDGARELKQTTMTTMESKPFVTQRQQRVKDAFYELNKVLEGKKIFKKVKK